MHLSCKNKWGPHAVPYVFAQAILIFIYYVYNFRFIIDLYKEHNIILAAVLVVVFHILFILLQVSYFKCSFTDPGGIPAGFPEEYENSDVQLNVSGESVGMITGLMLETNKKGERRKCDKCDKTKPDRCHHCRLCNRCVLKMDHHCPWVNNCVGFHNYKYFLLFLTWTITTAFYIAACFANKIIELFSKGGSDIFIVSIFIITLVFGLGLSMFAGTHFVYVFKNHTTIEVLEKRAKRRSNPYDLGSRANFRQVFGANPYLWFLPVYTTVGNGLSFPRTPENGSLISGNASSEEEGQ